MDDSAIPAPPPEKQVIIRPDERRFALHLGILIAAISSIPYIAVWIRHPAGFTGLLYDNAQDSCVYLAWMRRAAEGHFFFPNRFTTDPQHPYFTHALFWGMGRVAGWLGDTPGVHLLIYHGARLLFTILLFQALARLLSLLLPEARQRRTALALAAFSGGLGCLAALAGAPPAWRGLDFGGWLRAGDNWMRYPVMPEVITFLSILYYPHFAAALVLLCYCLECALRSGYAAAVRLWLAALLLGHIHPYVLPPLLGSLLLFAIVRALRERRAPDRGDLVPVLAVALAFVPALVYHAFLAAADPVWRSRAAIPVLTPPARQWLATFGLLLPTAAAGCVLAWRLGGSALLLPAWGAAAFVSAMLPVPFQRKMLEGVHLPLSALSALGICWLAARCRRPWLAPALTAVTFCSMGALIGDSLFARGNSDPWRMYPPLALPADERKTLDWLSRHAKPGDGVLSWRGLALYLPVTTSCAAYVGHWGETPRFQERLRKVAEFYAPNTSSQDRNALLAESRVRFVFVGSAERHRGAAAWRLDDWPRLRRAFAAGNGILYEVVPKPEWIKE